MEERISNWINSNMNFINKFAKEFCNDFIPLLEFDCCDGLYGWSGDGIYLDGIFNHFKVIGEQKFFFGIFSEDLKKLNFENSLFIMQVT